VLGGDGRAGLTSHLSILRLLWGGVRAKFGAVT
jgi:hypothetical protein